MTGTDMYHNWAASVGSLAEKSPRQFINYVIYIIYIRDTGSPGA